MKQEIWKDIPNYEGYYQVSNLGRVRSLDRYITRKDGRSQFYEGQILKPYYQGDKVTANIGVNNKSKPRSIARLVLEAFIGIDPNKPLAMNIDGNTYNNSLNNLKWATRQEVANNSIKLGTLKPVTSKRVRIFKDNHTLEFPSARDAEKYLGCSYGTIARIAKGTQKHIYGWKAKYIDNIEKDTLQLDGEVWKDIPGYEDVYQASTLGRIRSKDRIIINSLGNEHPYKGRIIKPQTNREGYQSVRLHNQDGGTRTSVHRLIALTFIPNEEEKPDINHINHIKDDNRMENIEWVTPLENNLKAIEFYNNQKSITS